jgi:hypothetical protein
MEQTKIEIFFGKFALYIVAFFAVLSLALGTGWYVSNQKLDSERSHSAKVETQLSVSNASYRSIKGEFQGLTEQLKENQERALENQAILQDRLQNIVESDRSRLALEQRLLTRAPTTDCKMPQELIDAWSKM